MEKFVNDSSLFIDNIPKIYLEFDDNFVRIIYLIARKIVSKSTKLNINTELVNTPFG